ncbi:MAG: hypothetical protein ACRD17_12750 [Terriglobales bacterium]
MPTATRDPLREEFDFFTAHQVELVEKYAGKAIVIRGGAVESAYGTPLEAFLEARARFAPGTFMVQVCAPGPSAYSLTLS